MFDLSADLIDQIIFAMENQDQDFVIDTVDGALLPVSEIREDDPENGERYASIPPWTSVDGYGLMERFTASLRNPVYRELLRQALSAGRGVFRQFKNVLKERAEIERLWYHFKQRQMRKAVLVWYNSLRELRGLDEVDIEFDAPDDLVLSDFSLVDGLCIPYEQALFYDRRGFFECFPDDAEDWVSREYERRRMGLHVHDNLSAFISAVNPTNDFTGFIWIRTVEDDSREIKQIYVLPEYRGLGLADLLMARFLEGAARQNVRRIFLELAGLSLRLGAAVRKKGFAPLCETLCLDARAFCRGERP